MFKNTLKTSFRNIINQKWHTVINIAGLAVGIASVLLIMLYVVDEMSYDRFHPNAKNIYRVYLDGKVQDSELIAPITSCPIGPTAAKDYPDIENFTRVFSFGGDPDVRYNDRIFTETRHIYVDSTFFQVFSGFKMVKGNPDRILQAANQVVLTETAAKKYFDDEEPMGKILHAWDDYFTWEVVGVIEDIPKNSHIQFDIATSIITSDLANDPNWINNNYYTYMVLKKGLEKSKAEKHLADLVEKHVNAQYAEFVGSSVEDLTQSGFRWAYFLQPLLDIHLKSNMPYDLHQGSSIVMIYVFIIVAILIIALAVINFINISTARSIRRAKEVGIRKVVGSTIGNLIRQFLSESFLITAISLILAVGIVMLALPLFNSIMNKAISLSSIPVGITITILLSAALLVGIVSGAYPAFFLSSFKPVEVLKGKPILGLKRGVLRHVLIVVQFSITIGLIVATLVVYKQINLITKKDLGYDPSQVMVIERLYAVNELQSIIEEIKNIPNVEEVARAEFLPTTMMSNTTMQKEDDPSNVFQSYCIYAQHGLDKVLKLKMIEGRYFDEAFASDTGAMVINRAAAKGFGFEGSPIGKTITIQGWKKKRIIGVMEDFHFESLHNQISPLVIAYQPSSAFLAIRLKNGDMESTIDMIKTKWEQFSAGQDLKYFFLDDAVANQYKSEKYARMLFAVFALLAIFIGGIGTVGLSFYIAEQRTQEVGVRKVMGATITSVVWLMFKEISKLVIISSLIAWPIAWYFMNRWLQGFAYRIELNPIVFLGASLLAFMLAAVAVSYQTYRLARVNPALTLNIE